MQIQIRRRITVLNFILQVESMCRLWHMMLPVGRTNIFIWMSLDIQWKWIQLSSYNF